MKHRADIIWFWDNGWHFYGAYPVGLGEMVLAGCVASGETKRLELDKNAELILKHGTYVRHNEV